MKPKYILITAAYNEEAFIEKTIRSVIAQTVLPKKWLIVSDGSTDRTDEIVKSYAQNHDWMELLRMPEHTDRHFAAKAHAFNAGYERVRSLEFDIVGNIDADISFDADFFEYLLDRFAEMPTLGVGGTHYIEDKFHSYKDSYIDVHHVNGQCQMFRRRCLEEIGGYMPIKGGGIDWIAVRTARMKGWETFSFEGRVFTHHRAMGTANSNTLRSRFHYGKKDYFLGGHPLWELFRGIFQMGKRPYLLGGCCLILGYTWAWASRMERPVSPELMNFHRSEQIQRLRELILKRMLRLRHG